MTLTELKKGLLKLMQSRYPKNKYKYYSTAVVEGYDRPCFFTELRPIDMKPVNYNVRRQHVVFYITVFPENKDESEMLNMIQEIEELMGLGVRIGDRFVDVIDFGWNYTGTDRNIPEIAVELQWDNRIDHSEDAPLMEHIKVDRKMEG